jgi:hypothetical protein
VFEVGTLERAGYLRAVFVTESLLAVCAALDVEDPISAIEV